MKKIVLGILVLLSVSFGSSAIDDSVALENVKSSKIIFDVNIADAKKMPLYLSVIKQTYEGLQQQNVKPDIILAFRGKAVAFLVREGNSDKIVSLINELMAKENIKVEACNVAATVFGVNPSNYLKGVHPVGNTFISLGAYQSKGYAIIPLY